MSLKLTPLLVGLMLLTVPAPAFASAKTAARAAAQAGIEALEAGRYDEAIRLLKSAEETHHAPTHLLLIAQAQEKKGDLVGARETLLSVVHNEAGDASSTAFTKAKEDAKSRAAALEPRIPRLKIELNVESTEGVEVLVDGQAIPSAAVGVPYPVNPGLRVVTARAGQLEAEPLEVELSEGTSVSVRLAFTLENKSESPESEEKPVPKEEPGSPELAPKESGLSWMVYTGFGVGAAGLIAGSITGVMSMSKHKELEDELCVDSVCPMSAESDVNQAKTLGNISTVGFAVGAAGIALGTFGLFQSGGSEKTASWSPAVFGFAGPNGGQIQGKWRFW